jgi:cytochrome c553
MHSLKVWSCTMLAVFFISNASVLAEDKSPQSSASYVPSLGDLMAAIQLRHSKLWYAAQLRNWPLADYELEQLYINVKEATRFYSNIPATSDMSVLDRSAALVGEAIKTKDGRKFVQSFAQMTTACNSCHEAAGRAFILVRKPALPSPYSNQVFAPSGR